LVKKLIVRGEKDFCRGYCEIGRGVRN